ncbi:MAG: hypothetical protein HN964_05120 [Candidatus Jacksonbacteria bacterium]|jgi:hypothetical protein|nr:hypothetical protein [Candidatus Jacksonbacteria bacterium]
MSALKSIVYCFPSNTREERDFWGDLSVLLLTLPNAEKIEKSITITPGSPHKSLPITIFEQSDVFYPSVLMDNDNQDGIEIKAGNFVVTNSRSQFVTKKQETTAFNQITTPLSIADFLKKFKEHIIRIDHTGVNIPEKCITKEYWEIELKKLGKGCNLYEYPTTDDWLFILPSNEREHKEEIKDFKAGREPKFELVYDVYSKYPTIQLDIETDLSRKEVEELLPAPYGISFEGVEDYFRSMFISHPWTGLVIRIDVRFKNGDNQPTEWETGEWLVIDGKRI